MVKYMDSYILLKDYFVKSTTENYNESEQDIQLKQSEINLILLVLMIIFVLFIWAAITLFNNWNKLSTFTQVIGLIGVIIGMRNPIGSITTIIAVNVNLSLHKFNSDNNKSVMMPTYYQSD